MSTLDTGLTLIRTAAGRVSAANGWMGQRIQELDADGLYARALLIMIVRWCAAVGGGVRVHGAALEHSDAAAFRRCRG